MKKQRLIPPDKNADIMTWIGYWMALEVNDHRQANSSPGRKFTLAKMAEMYGRSRPAMQRIMGYNSRYDMWPSIELLAAFVYAKPLPEWEGDFQRLDINRIFFGPDGHPDIRSLKKQVVSLKSRIQDLETVDRLVRDAAKVY